MVATSSGGTEMSLTTWRRWRARVIILSALVSSCAYGRCFFAAKSTTDLHTGVGVRVGGGACVWGGGGGGGGRGILGACREELQQ
jgi:hypothetical protein